MVDRGPKNTASVLAVSNPLKLTNIPQVLARVFHRLVRWKVMGKYIIVLCAAPILGLTGCRHSRETKLTPTQEKTTAAKTQPAAYFHRANGQACTGQEWHKEFLQGRKVDCAADDLIVECSGLEYKHMGDMTPIDLRLLEECKQLPPETRTATEQMATEWMHMTCKIDRENEYRNPELVNWKQLADCRSLGFSNPRPAFHCISLTRCCSWRSWSAFSRVSFSHVAGHAALSAT